MKQLPKHHYIPVFYLKQWADSKGRLTAFKRPHGHTVIASSTTPKHTGYIRGLYWLEGANPEVANRIETITMGHIDTHAATAHQFLLRDDIYNLPPRARVGWAAFIMGTLLRSPESVRNIYEAMTTPGTEEFEDVREEFSQDFPHLKYEELPPEVMKRAALFALPKLIHNAEVTKAINAMQWSVYDLGLPELSFVTSDRPVITNNGIGNKDGHIAIPISPRKLFLAFANDDIRKEIQSKSPWEIAETVNTVAVRSAIEVAWDRTAYRLPFMKRNLSADAKDDLNFFKTKPHKRSSKKPRI